MRKSLIALFGVLVLLIAACAADDAEDPIADLEDEDAEEVEDAEEEIEVEELPENAVEIFSWWTGAGEEAGLLALIDLFQEQYPEYDVVNSAVAGGAGTDARAVLASRMQAGDPPGTFQIHAGRVLLDTWVAADAMEPLNFLYEEEGWFDVSGLSI